MSGDHTGQVEPSSIAPVNYWEKWNPVPFCPVMVFGGKNVLPLYRLVHWKVSFIQRCPIFRVSFIRGSTVRCTLYTVTFILSCDNVQETEEHADSEDECQ